MPPYLTGTGLTSTIDISAIQPTHAFNSNLGTGTSQTRILKHDIATALADNQALPRLKEVWKWIKNLLSNYMKLRTNFDGYKDLISALKTLLNCTQSKEVLPQVETLLGHSVSLERLTLMLKKKYRMQKTASVEDIEGYLSKQLSKHQPIS